VRAALTQSQTEDRIHKEIEVLKRLQSCRGIIQLLDSYEDDKQVHIVTELCPGGDLQKYVHSQVKTCKEVIRSHHLH
jgi:serine/threonine protein kinase